MKEIDNDELESKIFNYLKQFKASAHGIAMVTENVAFDMKNLVRQNRQNYWGVFNKPTDPATGRKRIWAPLTRFVVDTTDKNTHIDEKEILYRAKKPNRQEFARIVRGYGQNQMRKMHFGTRMDALRKQKYIDGTSIVRITKATKNKDGITVEMKRVDRLNFDIDVTVDSIALAPSVGERDLMTPFEVKSEKDWINTEDIQGQENLARNDPNNASTNSKQKLVEIYRYEGLAPISFITGKEKKEDGKPEEMINQRIIVSGLDKDEQRIHLVEKLKNDRKTYIENWAEKIPGRWDGYAPAERVSMMQLYQNTVLNTRIIKNSVASLGLYKIKKGSGITPQQIARLAGNGVLKVNQMDDAEQWQMAEAGVGSYNDEEVATKWAQRDTNSFDSATGEEGVRTTATEAAINARASGSSFEQMAKEEASFWERVFNEQIVPLWGKCIKKEDIVRLTLDGDELREYDLELADIAVDQFIEDAGKKGIQYIDIAEIEAVKAQTLRDLEAGNTDRYETAIEDLNLADYDVEVVVKAQRFDRNLIAQGLMGLAQMNPQLLEQIVPQLNDLWGVNLKMPRALPEATQGQGEQEEQGQLPSPDIQKQLTSALTQQGQGL